jgi:GTPase SAR1 family protein
MASGQNTLNSDCIVKIVMLGATGVGKTSLLAAMYPFLMTHFPGDEYQLVPEENTKKRLDELTAKLDKLGEGGILVSAEENAIANSPQASGHAFDLQYSGSGRKPFTEIKLRIWDLPGAYYTEGDGSQAVELLNMADVTFWCIDSVSLMERNGNLNEKVNAAQKVIDCLANSNINSSHTFVVTLMRCEKWEQNEKDGKGENMQELFRRFKDEFAKPLIKICRDRRIGKVYYTAIQTTGNLRINSFDGETPQFVRHQGRTYTPENCELPVLCAVQQSMDTVINKSRNTLERIRNVPFIRLFSPAYWKAKARIKRLKEQLTYVEQAIKEHTEKSEADKRLFEW